jgi:molybdopterin-guanine dinucleotide biosynthesis protein A
VTAGAVLCGGASRRMGSDKALVAVSGVAMAERVARTLDAGGCHPVVFVGGDAEALGSFDRPVLPDRHPGGGPVGGVLTALLGADGDVIVAACDLADLDAATVGMVRAAGEAAAPVVDVVVAHSDHLEPLLAWWRGGSVAAVSAHWDDGVRAMHDLLAQLDVAQVAVDPAAMRNVNTPADLAGGTGR